MKRLFPMFIALLFAPFLLGQSGINGKVIDSKTDEPLISASIFTGEKGTTTDFDGSFKLELEPGTYNLLVSYIGYQDHNLSIEVKNNTFSEINVTLEPTNTLLETATISGSRYERRLAESPVSISVIKTDLIQNVNTVEINTLLDKIPGLQIIDGQANIRGGSGYSFGAGSRVMLLIDDVPTMQPDAGRPNWSDIPVENIHQVEVLKGASSVMYGSSALNGIINIRTGYAVSEPVTKANISYQTFDSPIPTSKGTSRQWWDDGFFNAPNRVTAAILHKRKIGKMDLVANAYVDDFDFYYQESFKKKYRGSVNLRYRLNDRTAVGMNSVYNNGHTNTPFLRKDAIGGSYKPLESTLSDSRNVRMYFDPYITHYDKNKNKHKLLMRYYYINNDNNNNQANSSKNYYADYQHVRQFKLIDGTFSGGLTAFHLVSDSELFGDSKFSADNFGSFVQIEKKLFDRINLSGGLRYEYNSHQSPEVFMGDTIPGGKISEGKMIKRFSVNGELGAFTFVRASYGEGYRYPTITERFIFTNFATFTIFPNVNITSEVGWSTEIGVRQGFNIGGFKGYLDYSYFWSRYEDMLEFTFVTIDGILGFQTQNIGNVDIKGHEINIIGQLEFGSVPVNILCGYTYLDPTYLDFETNEQIRNSITPSENVLKYRNKHNFKIDLESKYEEISMGFAINHTSNMVTVDAPLATQSGITEYRSFDNDGYWKMDARVAYQFSFAKLSFIANNLTNELYTARPGLFEEPRSYALRLDFDF